eukprot:TRINITY_DN3233_c0_g1_i1.p1 TRINITY_DN3233_c0_g1~~TRINITY_DN3233_c0_g1_i1.p1  ORF type:complete len:538 (+),score=84.18 TRINITY_DN3233_c0_g1_i1:240-1616(+)
MDESVIYTNCKIIISGGEDYVGYISEKKDKSVIQGSIPQHNLVTSSSTIKIFQQKSLVEPEAIKQLESTAKMPNVMVAVGLPDLHPGKGCPIGAAWASKGVFYPHLIGNDIGCGMSFYKTSIKNKRIKLDSWISTLHGLESPWEEDTSSWLESSGVAPTPYDQKTLGTIGGGNHFAELQQVEEILDPTKFSELGLNSDYLYLLVHSGSRALGENVLRTHLDAFGYKGLVEGTVEAENYLKQHDAAMAWAKCNRELIAHRFMHCLTQSPIVHPSKLGDGKSSVTSDGSTCILDIWHNCAVKKEFVVEIDGHTQKEHLWLHRKGAAPSDSGVIVIPGSRGAHSYVVLPIPDIEKQQSSAYSLAHGAGRRLPRNVALKKGESSKGDLTVTDLGGRVICEKKDLLYEEIPDAYKDIDNIIQDLVSFGLIEIIAKMRPLITYKTRVKSYDKVDYRKEEEEPSE